MPAAAVLLACLKLPWHPAAIDHDVKSLLDWVLRNHPDTPRHRAKQWILAGRVSVGGEVIRKPHQPLPDPGNRLELRARHAGTLDCGSGWPIHRDVSLLYLDSALAVVNKGPGLISLPARDTGRSALDILAEFLAGNLKAPLRGTAGRVLPAAFRRLEPLPVHRLDRYTSGVFCMATNPDARQHLVEQVKSHAMTREYIAFVEGKATAPKGTWRQTLQLSADERRQEVFRENRQLNGARISEAITHFEVLAEYPLLEGRAFVTKLRLRLETGLRHQIRLQAAQAGLPLVGDRTYHPSCSGSRTANRLVVFPRQALHSETLALEHPEPPHRRMTWTAELPRDLRQLEATLRSGRA